MASSGVGGDHDHWWGGGVSPARVNWGSGGGASASPKNTIGAIFLAPNLMDMTSTIQKQVYVNHNEDVHLVVVEGLRNFNLGGPLIQPNMPAQIGQIRP